MSLPRRSARPFVLPLLIAVPLVVATVHAWSAPVGATDHARGTRGAPRPSLDAPAKSAATTVTVQQANSGPSVDKGRCLTLPAGRFGTWRCGALQFAYALPSTKTMGRDWTPTLLFNSDQTGKTLRFAADISLQSSVTIDSVQVLAYWGTADTLRNTVSLPADGQSRRVVVQLLSDDEITVPNTGRLVYTIKAKAWGGLAVHATATDTGTVILVNRQDPNNDRFGPGWWLAGLEQLVVAANPIAWIGGDGSTRLYQPSGTTNTWIATPAVDRPDTLSRVVSSITNHYDEECECTVPDTVWVFRRLLPNGAYVEFDNAGRHAQRARVRDPLRVQRRKAR